MLPDLPDVLLALSPVIDSSKAPLLFLSASSALLVRVERTRLGARTKAMLVRLARLDPIRRLLDRKNVLLALWARSRRTSVELVCAIPAPSEVMRILRETLNVPAALQV